MEAIKTYDLTKFYGSARGIVELNLEVEEGDFFGFIGPNGAGKSTLIRTLLGLIAPSSGRAEIFGRDITLEKVNVLKNIGYLPSEAIFYDNMKARELLLYSAALRHLDCREEMTRLAKRLDLDLDKRIGELSLGNKKKVGIIAALQHSPSLYILDEPTSGLDPLMQNEFYEILRERNKNGATVFLSSHVLSEVAKNCKTAAIIREGRILLTERVEKLGHREAKRVSLKGNFDTSALDGVRDVQIEGESINFLYSGDVNVLLSHLSGAKLLDLSISDPDLDEIFLHYYGKEGV